MILLDIMIGMMDILLGLIVFISVIIIEGIFLSKKLTGYWISSNIMSTVFVSNLISTIIGAFGLLSWLWNIIVVLTKGFLDLNKDFTSNNLEYGLFFIIALILTLIFEIPINILFIRTNNNKKIILNTIYANIITYILIVLLTIIMG